MPTRVFFSFDFVDDLWRASVVRNRWIADPTDAIGGLWAPEFAGEMPPSRERLEQFVEQAVAESEVTAVLIGGRTASFEHVLHAIRRSAELGHGMLGIHVEQCRNQYGRASLRGRNPFERIILYRDGREDCLGDWVPVYDWVADDGQVNLSVWIERALRRSKTPR